MATHSSILAWRIPRTEELGGLQSTGRKESDIKWPEGMKKGGDLFQGSREAIKMLSILTFKLIG